MIADPLWIALVILAAARVTRFITDDYLSKSLRAWVMNKFGEDSNLSYLVHCIWCTGLWVSLGTVLLGYFGHGHWWAQLPILTLAVAQVAPALLSFGELKPQITINGKDGGPWR